METEIHNYLKWDRTKINDKSDVNIEQMYDQGYVFTRLGNGTMDQTRSLRIDIDEFTLNSENKRVLRKTESISFRKEILPYSDYHWNIHKMGKEFYDQFQEGLFTANKIKELMTTPEKSDFNTVFIYSDDEQDLGYSISLETGHIIHYSYPFYDREESPENMGMGMMIRAIIYAKESNKKYCYLGAAQRPGDTYKLQFEGVEWFNGDDWSRDLDKLKNKLKNS